MPVGHAPAHLLSELLLARMWFAERQWTDKLPRCSLLFIVITMAVSSLAQPNGKSLEICVHLFFVVSSSSELFDILSMSVLCLHCCISPHSQWTLGACVFPPSAFGLSVTQMSKLSEGPISSLHRWRWERWCQSLSAPNVTVVWGTGSGVGERGAERQRGGDASCGVKSI